MLTDKAPLSFSTDSPALVVRKALRSLTSSWPCLATMHRLAQVLERHKPDCRLLALLYRWSLSAYIYKGYRRGLREMVEEGA